MGGGCARPGCDLAPGAEAWGLGATGRGPERGEGAWWHLCPWDDWPQEGRRCGPNASRPLRVAADVRLASRAPGGLAPAAVGEERRPPCFLRLWLWHGGGGGSGPSGRLCSTVPPLPPGLARVRAQRAPLLMATGFGPCGRRPGAPSRGSTASAWGCPGWDPDLSCAPTSHLPAVAQD